jgi:hypothetical protein
VTGLYHFPFRVAITPLAMPANAILGGVESGSLAAPDYKLVKRDKDDIESVPGAVDADGAHLMQNMGTGAAGKVATAQAKRTDST